MLKTVWALFDSETACCKNTLGADYDVHAFGRGSGTQHIDMDLSDPEAAIKKLEKYPKPDVIFASPPSETWLPITASLARNYEDCPHFNLYWKCLFVENDFTDSQRKKRINGIATALTTVKIIRHFRPKFYAIENGCTSKIFRFIEEYGNFSGYKNKATYNAYGFNVRKPTIFLSNSEIILKTKPWENHLLKLRSIGGKDYASVTKVPAALYRDIMRQFEHGGQPTLFPLEEVS
jgi:hypothetical protein